jgi:Na+/melibiose symporter-like transporter
LTLDHDERTSLTTYRIIILAGAIVIAWTYPLTRTRHQEIQAELARRRVDRVRDWAAGERPARPVASE